MSEFYTIAEVAEILKIRKNYIYELVYKGELEAIRLSERRFRVPEQALLELGHLSLWTLTGEGLNSILDDHFDVLQSRSKKNLYDFTRTVVRSAIESHTAPQDALLGYKIPRAGKIEREVYTQSDLKTILGNLSGYRYGLVFRLLIVTGARAGEILVCAGIWWILRGKPLPLNAP